MPATSGLCSCNVGARLCRSSHIAVARDALAARRREAAVIHANCERQRRSDPPAPRAERSVLTSHPAITPTNRHPAWPSFPPASAAMPAEFGRRSNRVFRQVKSATGTFCQGAFVRTIALRMTMSLRMQATRATLDGLPAALRRW